MKIVFQFRSLPILVSRSLFVQTKKKRRTSAHLARRPTVGVSDDGLSPPPKTDYTTTNHAIISNNLSFPLRASGVHTLMIFPTIGASTISPQQPPPTHTMENDWLSLPSEHSLEGERAKFLTQTHAPREKLGC